MPGSITTNSYEMYFKCKFPIPPRIYINWDAKNGEYKFK